MYMWVRHFAVGVLLITSVSPCYSAAIDKMRTLAEQGDSTAQYELGRSYMEGRNNLPKSDTEAYYWYRKAAEQGNAEAQTALANLLEVGVGVKART